MQELRMTKELAEAIMKLSILGNNISNDKWNMQKDLDCSSWDEVQTKAMQFLLDEKAVGV